MYKNGKDNKILDIVIEIFVDFLYSVLSMYTLSTIGHFLYGFIFVPGTLYLTEEFSFSKIPEYFCHAALHYQ